MAETGTNIKRGKKGEYETSSHGAFQDKVTGRKVTGKEREIKWKAVRNVRNVKLFECGILSQVAAVD